MRGELPHFAGETGTFLKCPFLEDVHQVKDAEVAIFGAPLDTGTTYRPGTRFGPQGIRRATNLFGTYSFEYGVDLREQLNVVDIGDIFTIPANLEKSFDQISRGISHVVEQGVFPVVLGGDHSIGFPTVRGRGAVDRRPDRHHPFRPPRRYPGIRPRRAHAHDALVPRHEHPECAGDQPGPDWHRRLAGAARRRARSAASAARRS